MNKKNSCICCGIYVPPSKHINLKMKSGIYNYRHISTYETMEFNSCFALCQSCANILSGKGVFDNFLENDLSPTKWISTNRYYIDDAEIERYKIQRDKSIKEYSSQLNELKNTILQNVDVVVKAIEIELIYNKAKKRGRFLYSEMSKLTGLSIKKIKDKFDDLTYAYINRKEINEIQDFR